MNQIIEEVASSILVTLLRLKIIDLKYPGIVAADSRILKQEEGEKLDDFIERLKRLS